MNYDYKKLSPTNQVVIDAYKDALEFAFDEKDEDIKNIAITGGYGVGKSSVIRTYLKEQHKEKETAFIELMPFANENQSIDENEIERKIINQLAQQVKNKKIKRSNFKTKSNSRFSTLVWICCISVLLITALLNRFDVAIEFFEKDTIKTINCIALCVSFVAIVIIVCSIVFSLSSNRHLQRIGFGGNEIELSSENKDSSFDKYADELVYLVKKSGKKIICFEDLDRFNSTSVLSKIRELNHLININCSNNSTVKFVYLIRDDLFHQEERLKFFDFIVPIIPSIGPDNSFKIISDCFAYEKINESFLSKYALYIKDFRLLNNIFNEYTVYKSAIYRNIKDEKSETILLAIITYKNVFPQDFEAFRRKEGFLSKIIDEKKEKVTELSKKKKEEISEIHAELAEVEETQREEKLNELNAKKNELNEINNRSIGDCVDIERIKELIEEYYKHAGVAYDKLFCEMMCYFVRNGWIDSSCEKYINSFFDSRITKDDELFLRAIANQNELEWDANIDNIDAVLDRLDISDFCLKAILNYKIVVHFFKEQCDDAINEKKRVLADFLNDNASENKEFFVSFMRYCQNENLFKEFVVWFVNNTENVLEVILTDEKVFIEEKTDLISMVLVTCDKKSILTNNKNSCVSSFIEENWEQLYGTINERNENWEYDILNKLEIKVETLGNISSGNTELYKFVVDNNLYKVNRTNFDTLCLMCNLSNDNKNQNYLRAVMTIEDEYKCIKEYFYDNIMQLFNSLNEATQIFDNEFGYQFLNDDKKSTLDKKRYCILLSDRIYDISNIKELDVMQEILKANCADCNMKNLLAYYRSNNCTIDSIFIGYLKKNETCENVDYSDYESEIITGFFINIAENNDIPNNLYEQLFVYYDGTNDNINIETLYSEKVEILIKVGYLSISPISIKNVLNYHDMYWECFVTKNIDELLKIESVKKCVDQNKLEEILGYDISNENKLRVLGLIEGPVNYCFEYSDDVNVEIISKHFMINDVQTIQDNYDVFDKRLKTASLSAVICNIDEILSQNYTFDGSLFNSIITSKDLTIEQKSTLFISSIEPVDEIIDEQSNVIVGLKELGLEEIIQIILQGGWKTIIPENKVIEIINKVKECRYISSYSMDGEKYRVNGFSKGFNEKLMKE